MYDVLRGLQIWNLAFVQNIFTYIVPLQSFVFAYETHCHKYDVSAAAAAKQNPSKNGQVECAGGGG